ncbi:sensor histidine kinase [Nonomuraea aridisoli]|uniref:sensor histidine kinase n=1 Tax=Nonomuraea aridisoli TaxID=2070368 RepID=UPI0015E8DA5E|nr:ATP-binding protein [Nonomuraea aridisoli]
MTLLVLVVVAVVGVSLDLAIRYKIRNEVFGNAERVADRWSARVRAGGLPHPIPPSAGIDLIQLVDARGNVVGSSPRAAGRPPLSGLRPTSSHPLQQRTECSGKRCVLLTASRVSPSADASVVYAGAAEPSYLTAHDFEYVIAVTALMMAVVGGRLTWRMMSRALRQVEEQYELASTTAHELRNPIAGLRLQLEEALCYPDRVNPRDAIREALSTGDRLEAIVEDLLLQARLHGGEPMPYEPIDLGALVEQEAGMPSQDVPVQVRVVGDVWVRGSRIQLIRLVSNLVANARRHAEAHVAVCVTRAHGQAVLVVTDDGAGIEPADRERVFERFVRLEDGRRREAGGSGLGLAISRDIAHAHQGTLRIEDSSRGARFVLRLPLLEESCECVAGPLHPVTGEHE